MRILLDTCTFLWIITDSTRLSRRARTLYMEKSNEVYLSAVSTWEITLKFGLGKLNLPVEPTKYIPMQRKQHHISSYGISEEATLYISKLPDIHKDPFDRMLICQAITSDMVLLTPDEFVTKYPVRCDW
ncbi:MAG: type II toxin-antitoxin system VapC family toxin [Deltaproteobacteria bacterium]|nr:type II toxin-antitoxin system VapC family toxin [Deltaproteobacteria bacterium]MBT4269680.1 type II toxin-antitoxin system VapC family toxin [Deltaproteobacteria bacterium]MBT4637230.1 type II toxin-antitoxin system VapC family toxin [Deltaproteobacteria bacterium]MBT6502450.1 type II toxin-antitoxin system VapC family toxin [Deltaproteobacteria bacterium]MBT6612909.1 type II toxin-antitoxin system VapC family toxin [Deltaproteobacteria bacterium]